MASDLTIHLDDEPGALARIGEALGGAGVNIDGLCAVTKGGGMAEVHVLVQDAGPAFECLSAAGIGVEVEREVAVVDVADEPGVLGRISRTLGDAGTNIDLAYMATGTRLVIAADDLAGALAALDT